MTRLDALIERIVDEIAWVGELGESHDFPRFDPSNLRIFVVVVW